ncbi:MAG TPA: reverse transcriptase domain-containing protein [Candidatus Magasanikbacteria bacterium]|nr:reverse transcriptase domain-containing protein [Candidatus Magasanikbacteria bacterium]
MFREIISKENLEAAYLEIVQKFAKDGKDSRYHGLDDKKILDYEVDSHDLLSLIRDELIHNKAIEPALLLRIPKKSNPAKTREIFVYTLKERVKAQAIYRVVLPVFERAFSDRLFSYRPGKPPYIASYLFARRYRRRFRDDYCLVIDLHNYSSFINRDYLVRKLLTLFREKETIDALKLFIFNQMYDNGSIQSTNQGIVQGVPLIALFANLYLSDLDFMYDSQADFYIRVGDDLAIVDPDLQKLQTIEKELKIVLNERGLKLNHDKLFIGPTRDPFSFLGYHFSQGLISFEDSFITHLETEWKTILVYKNESVAKKRYILKNIMRRANKNFNTRFQEIIKNKSQVNDVEQIRNVSERFFQILTEFYYGQYSPQHRRLLRIVIKDLGIRSLYYYYKNFHYERRRT